MLHAVNVHTFTDEQFSHSCTKSAQLFHLHNLLYIIVIIFFHILSIYYFLIMLFDLTLDALYVSTYCVYYFAPRRVPQTFSSEPDSDSDSAVTDMLVTAVNSTQTESKRRRIS